MKTLLIFLFFIPTALCNGQSISISPTSIVAWGAAPETARAVISYKAVSLVIISANPEQRWVDREGNQYKGVHAGLFVHPVNWSAKGFYVRPGVGLLHKPFPTRIGTRLNFSIEAGIHLTTWLSFSYSHMSNGFGIANPENPGLDNINLTIHF